MEVFAQSIQMFVAQNAAGPPPPMLTGTSVFVPHFRSRRGLPYGRVPTTPRMPVTPHLDPVCPICTSRHTAVSKAP